jgi:thiamine transport system substrate-binding protein
MGEFLMRKWLILILLLSSILAVACDDATGDTEAPAATVAPAAPGDEIDVSEEELEEADVEEATESAPVEPAEPAAVLTVMTHDSFDMNEDLLVQFEAEHNVRLELLPAGDTGTALNQAILASDNPLADVFYGVDNTFLSRALDAGIFEPYESPLLAAIPDRYELDETYQMLPVDYGDVCLNYDRTWFEENEADVPQSLAALTDPAYEGLLVVENPATSSPGLAFMLATIGNFGTDGEYTWLNFWADLRQNDLLVTNDWNEAYYSHFTVASDGERPLVVSYASSPPAEVIFADPPVDEAPSGSVTAPQTCFRQIEFVGILAGTEQRELAETWIDFMLDEAFQEAIPSYMFVFPVNENAELPAEFAEYAEIPEEPATVSPEAIDQNREEWIQAWTETVLR